MNDGKAIATEQDAPKHIAQTTAQTSIQSSAPATAQTSAARVSAEAVRHVAALANLELTADELPRMARDLDAVLGYIAQLDELDTSDIAPMAQVADSLGATPAGAGQLLRIDAVQTSVERSLVMKEAPETDGRFFKVPKVIER